jgi:arylsulfatase A-like enzyme
MVGLWLGDVVLLALSRGGATTWQWLNAVASAFFVAATTGVVVGAAAGALLGPMARRGLSASSARWTCIRRGEVDARRQLTADVLSFLPLAAIWTGLAFRITSLIALDFARVDTVNGATVVLCWAFMASFMVAWSLLRWQVRELIDRIAASGGATSILDRAWTGPAVLVAVALFAVALFVSAYQDEVMALPWRAAFPLVGALAAVFVFLLVPWTRAPWGRRASGVLGVVGALAFAASAVAALRLRPESTTVRRLAFDRSLSGSVGYAAWTLAFDFDRDGQIGILGGGDCAPFDPRRYTGAVDIPGNGIDEDCDGTDLAPVVFPARSITPFVPASLVSRATIVLITIDAVGAGRLAQLGASPPLMPNVDAFASRSFLFSECFSQGPSTRLSFPSMFTSRWDSQLSFEVGRRLPYSFSATQRQLQDVLDDAGYQTVAVIPNEYFDRARWPSVTRGFQRVDTSALGLGKHNAAQVTDAALRVLSEERDRPLYLWVHYYDAHPPYLAIPGVEYPHSGDQALYEAELAHVDREMARLLGALEQRPEPTYVFLTSDHSTVFHPNPTAHPHHYGYDLYSATLHVPLLVHGPGLRTGRSDALVSTMDIAPTIADVLRWTERSTHFEGTSLLPVLIGQAGDPDRFLFHEFYLPERLFHGYEPLEMVSVHRGNWNLILNRVKGAYELYDWHATDYYEQNDRYEELAGTPEVARLRSLLAGFVQQYGHTDNAVVTQPSADRRFQLGAGEP